MNNLFQYNTTTQLLNVIDHIANKAYTRKVSAAALLDIKKAFDKVQWHAGLLYKLIQFQIPDQLLYLVKSFFENCSFRIKILTLLLVAYKQKCIKAPTCPPNFLTFSSMTCPNTMMLK